MADRDEPVYVISVAAELAGMHPQTLRAYERKGLVDPQRTAGNTRRYSARDVDRLELIAHLTQEQGLNLAGVRMVIEMYEQLERMRARADELERQLAEAARRLRDEVVASRRSGYELVPVKPGQVELHPDFPRSVRSTPDRSTAHPRDASRRQE
ncbi:MAG TPA: helix-turn-helix transcriptional regulator [Nitriliruptorales bacterium]